ncbi:MAG: methyltransferase domain-containing protein [Vampirovibrionales bacterium]
MASSSVMPDVNEQYEQWVYPEPIADLDAYFASNVAEQADPRMVHWLYWPTGWYAFEKQEAIDILVAGCGCNQAAKLAYAHPKARVVGVDMSQSSLAHAHFLKEKHQLSNLTLHCLDLHQVSTLTDTPDGQFDLIISTGVLHHLPDPLTGLKALKPALRSNGTMVLMVYGLYGRMGLYAMQQAFQLMGLGQTKDDVALVRSVLKGLPATHPVQPMLQHNLDMNYDAGVVDMFLHPMDHGFSVTDCLEWIHNAGLAFQGWLDPFDYEASAWITDSAVKAKIQALPKPQQWQVMELLNGGIRTHTMLACHPERPINTRQPDMTSVNFNNAVVIRRVHHFQPADTLNNKPAYVQHLPHHPIPLSPPQAALFETINNSNTVADCAQALKPFVNQPDEALKATKSILALLYELGLVLFYCS